jgi:hypothetical protein
MRTTLPSDTELDIWDRVLQSMDETLSPEEANALLRLKFSSVDKDRMHVLAAKARDGSLTAAEKKEIRTYETVGNVLGFIKSKSRQFLKAAARANGSGH